jgi:L-seryl-tRNA(Ser) seleniumtransferase
MQPDFSKIPPMDRLLNDLTDYFSKIDPIYTKQIIETLLKRIKANPDKYKILEKSREEISQFIKDSIIKKLDTLLSPTFKHIINATGVILHTGLGRAPLGDRQIEQIKHASGYTNLEIQIDSGKRGERLDHVNELLCILSGAEDAVVVNNNAAAVLLVLNSLTRRKEVIVSRGELVEIGGSFRMPEVMKASGTKMVEIGATNKTHLSDYEQAITEKTAAILMVHPSNYKILGFTAKPEAKEILALAHKYHIPVIFDLGSGAFSDFTTFGFEYEPVIRDVVAMDFDIVTFSGDKLLGGPQAGIIIGKSHLVKRIKKNHLLRALRCDKINLALLSATLRQYLNQGTIADHNLTYQLFSRTQDEMNNLSRQLLEIIDQKHHNRIKVVKSDGRAGSGAYPIHPIPSISIQIECTNCTAEKFARQLRQQDTPVFGYIEKDIFHLNMLTVLEKDIPLLGKILNTTL